VDFEDWKRWAYSRGIDGSIIAFLNFDKGMLFTFDPSSNEKSFATPRSWEYVDTIIKSSIPHNLILDSISGAVGREAAIAYISFKRVMHQLPDLSRILDGTMTDVEEREDPKLMMALSIGLVNLLIEHDDRDAVANVLRFSLGLPGEYAIMLVKDMQLSGIDVEGSDSWGEWVEKFAYLLA